MNLDTSTWKKFRYDEIFVIETGKDLIYSTLEHGEYPVIGHNKTNNGVTAYTLFLDNYKLYDSSKTIVLADRGNFFASVQTIDFYIGTRVKALIYKFESDKYILLFIATIINLEEFRYCYGRNACDRLDTTILKLPIDSQGKPDSRYMRDFIKQTIKQSSSKVKQVLENKSEFQKPLLSQATPTPILNTKEWKEFLIKALFVVKAGKGDSKNTDIGMIPYVSATALNNGVSKFVSYDERLLENPNTITVSRNGSVGECFYHHYSYIASLDDIRVLTPINFELDKYIAHFIITCIKLEQPRYNYGRKFGTDRIKNTIINLPIDAQGNPDLNYMENYIKTLPYSASL